MVYKWTEKNQVLFAYLEQIMIYILMLNATRSTLEEDETASFYFELLVGVEISFQHEW